jgi:hypothetical protein
MPSCGAVFVRTAKAVPLATTAFFARDARDVCAPLPPLVVLLLLLFGRRCTRDDDEEEGGARADKDPV